MLFLTQKSVQGLILWLRGWFDEVYSQTNHTHSDKVDKETGKGLSTNDYTTAEKTKLANIESQANKTVVDSAMSGSSTNPVQNKVIWDNCMFEDDYDYRTVSNRIPIELNSGDQYMRGMGFRDGDTLEEVLEYFAGSISNLITRWETVYPIGAVYISVNDTNPSQLFGGTWQRLEDTFLFATSGTADTGYQATAGSKDAVVVEHNHTQVSHNHGSGDSTYPNFMTTNINIAVGQTKRTLPATGSNYYFVYSTEKGDIGQHSVTDSKQPTINNRGESPTDKNMPPYMKVYMWKRVQ